MDPLVRNNVQVAGRGEPAVIFAHGFGCDLHAWAKVAPAFEDRARVVLFDHVGAGASDRSAYDFTKYGTLHGYAEDVAEIAEALDLKQAIFVGHSVSGMIGMLAAQRVPGRIGAMIMLCPSPCYVDDGAYVGGFSRGDIDDLLEVLDSNFLAWSRSAAPAVMGNADRPELAEGLADSFCRTDPTIAKAFARVTFLSDHRADLPDLQTPTLILQTRQDMIAPMEVGAYMQASLPNSRLVIMEATGHYPHMSAPEETIEAISRYLSEKP